EMPIVSIKYMLSRLWFIVGFYFLGTQLFKNYKNIKRFIWLYTLPLLGVIIYTLIRHAYYGFSQESSTWVMEPFYKNHGVYAVAIAMLFPLMIIYMIKANRFRNNLLQNAMIVITNIIFLVGMIFSYTRAAWLSLAVAVMALFVFQFKVQLRSILLVVSVIAGIGLYNFHELDMALNRNVQDSSTDFQEHVKSISNVSTNASNMERLNRWNCAIRMFLERPIVGWGPGTYMFQYGQFQKPSELTIISTNAGIRGNAHSEYLGPLAESGFLGFFTYFLLILIVIDRGMKLYYTLEDKELKYLILGILLGFITYVVHGVLNNYLDMDKAAVPFWAFIAIITSIDIYHNKTKQISDSSEQLRHQ
ncbi:MAG: O-antigen ligase family protein, partial [Bacteroidia bacterium]|nr:O-antigen ligase family protein [Bacteroidia bacterium]